MRIFISEEVQAAAKTHNLESDLKKIEARLQQLGVSALGQFFGIRYPFWKRNLQYRYRLVGDLRWVDNTPVLHLFGLWTRGSEQYQDFLHRRGDPGYQMAIRSSLSQQHLEGYIRSLGGEPEGERKPLPEDLYQWLNFLGNVKTDQQLILESSVWREQFSRLCTDQQSQVYEMVLTLADDKNGDIYHGLKSYKSDRSYPKVYQRDQIHLIISRITCNDLAAQPLLLIGVLTGQPNLGDYTSLGGDTNLFGIKANREVLDKALSLEELKPYVRRSYPDFMLSEKEIWLEMQQSDIGNYALSMEEESILSHPTMPLLITGRAGSGKSLMLYYRFSDYCRLAIEFAQRDPQTPYQPLFLAYNANLIEQARRKVKTLLRVHYGHLEQGSLTPEQIASCDSYFRTFHELLISLLPIEKQERYQEDKYINYHRFQQLIKHQRGAELAWHVIRSLIKGYEIKDADNPHDYMTPEDFQEVPHRDRSSVSDQDFQKVYDGVWQAYQNYTLYQGYWDDQDLVRDVILYGQHRPIYPAIFCDEVQDFTNLELLLILRLSPWTHFQLHAQIDSLPYAFAGDPMQTINPTGFRWDSLKKHLYEEIISYLPFGTDRFQIQEPHELVNNYRCNPRITKFSNVINLWRRVLFQETSLKPQQPWRPQQGGIPVQSMILGDHITPKDLESILKSGIICLLPCDQGGELGYITQDQDLRTIFAEELKQDQKPAMLQTASSIKGMEFTKVILYKFGEFYCSHQYNSLLRVKEKDVNYLAIQYFLNKLYVSVTRPIEALAIIDTKLGYQQFWKPNLEIHQWRNKLDNHHRQTWEQQYLETMVPVVNLNAWVQRNQQEDLEQAKQFLAAGIQEEDLQKLQDAEMYAKRAGDNELVRECQAWAAKIQRDYQQAGRLFLNLENLITAQKSPKREAWECFWKGKCWLDLKQNYDQHFLNDGIPNYKTLVDFMSRVPALLEKKDLTENLRSQILAPIRRWHEWLDQAPQLPKWQDSTWQSCLETYSQAVEQILNSLPILGELSGSLGLGDLQHRLNQLLEKLPRDTKQARKIKALIAEIYYQEMKYQEAIQLWEEEKDTNYPHYYKAKIHVTSLPEKLEWLCKDHQDHQVIDLWKAHGYPMNGSWEDHIKWIKTALGRLRDWPLLMRLLLSLRQWSDLWQLIQKYPQSWQRGHDYQLVTTIAWDPYFPEAEVPKEFLDFVRQVLKIMDWEEAWNRKLTRQELRLASQKLGYDSAIRLNSGSLAATAPEPSDAWHRHFVSFPSPVQVWLVAQEYTDRQARLKAEIQEKLDQLSLEQLQKILDQIRSMPLKKS